MKQVEIKRQQIQLFSGIISILMLFLMGKMMGNNGVAYLAAAIECCSLVFLLIGGNVTDSLGKLLRGRNARGQYGNMSAMRRNIMLFQCILGAAAAGILFLSAEILAENVFKLPYSALAIQILAPAVFLRMVSAVLLGYFQGEGFALPAAVTAVVRQLFLLGFMLLFVNLFTGYGRKVSELLKKQEFTAMYGGVGAAVAVNVAEGLILLFLFLIYKGSRNKEKKQEESQKTRESFPDSVRILYGSMGSSVLIRVFERLPLFLGLLFFLKSTQDGAAGCGIFYGKYLAVCMLVILPVCAVLLPVCARAVQLLKKEEYRYAKNCLQSGVHFTWAGGLFFAVFFGTTAGTLGALLCGEQAGAQGKTLEKMLLFGSVVILFAVLSFFFEKLLLFSGKKYPVLCALGLMNAAFVLPLTLFLNLGKAGPEAIVYGLAIGTLVLTVLLGTLVFKQFHTKPDLVRTFLVPAGAAAAEGIVCILLGKFLAPHLGNLVTVLASLVLSAVIFGGILKLTHNFKEQEIAEMYKFRKKR